MILQLLLPAWGLLSNWSFLCFPSRSFMPPYLNVQLSCQILLLEVLNPYEMRCRIWKRSFPMLQSCLTSFLENLGRTKTLYWFWVKHFLQCALASMRLVTTCQCNGWCDQKTVNVYTGTQHTVLFLALPTTPNCAICRLPLICVAALTNTDLLQTGQRSHTCP